MKHLPSIEALTAVDDRRLFAELRLRRRAQALAELRCLVEHADRLLASQLAGGAEPDGAAPESVVSLRAG